MEKEIAYEDDVYSYTIYNLYISRYVLSSYFYAGHTVKTRRKIHFYLYSFYIICYSHAE